MTNHLKACKTILAGVLAVIPFAASADPWKDESGHGYGHGRGKHKQEYWDGNCKVERKFGRNGDYKEERKCKGRHPGDYAHAPVYGPAPAIVIDPGLTIHGTVTIRP